MQSAAIELMALSPDGLQLTPGNAPDAGFSDWLQKNDVHHIFHQGFSWTALRQKVWGNTGECLVLSHSVHPPALNLCTSDVWEKQVLNGLEKDALPVLEIMYPGYYLGSGDEIEWAMNLNIMLAVDVSHINIQRCAGLISDQAWRRLQRYQNIKEIHLSNNAGVRDSHAAINANSFGFAWAKERGADIPLVLECYMHNLHINQRHEQLDLIRR